MRLALAVAPGEDIARRLCGGAHMKECRRTELAHGGASKQWHPATCRPQQPHCNHGANHPGDLQQTQRRMQFAAKIRQSIWWLSQRTEPETFLSDCTGVWLTLTFARVLPTAETTPVSGPPTSAMCATL
jgi:hypothetical protein